MLLRHLRDHTDEELARTIQLLSQRESEVQEESQTSHKRRRPIPGVTPAEAPRPRGRPKGSKNSNNIDRSGGASKGQGEDGGQAKRGRKAGSGSPSFPKQSPMIGHSVKAADVPLLPKKLSKQEQQNLLTRKDSVLSWIKLKEIVSVEAWDEFSEEERESLLPLLLPEDRERGGLEHLLRHSPQFGTSIAEWQEMLSIGEYDPDLAEFFQMKRSLQMAGTRTARYAARTLAGLEDENRWLEMNALMNSSRANDESTGDGCLTRAKPTSTPT